MDNGESGDNGGNNTYSEEYKMTDARRESQVSATGRRMSAAQMAAEAQRKGSVALNVVENPLKVSQRSCRCLSLEA